MTATEFLKLKINQLSKKFPEANFRYQVDEANGDHLIEITPDSIYSASKEYGLAESLIIKEFVKKYQFESVVFFSDESYIKLDENSLIYSPVSTAWIKSIQGNLESTFNIKKNLQTVECQNDCNYQLAA